MVIWDWTIGDTMVNEYNNQTYRVISLDPFQLEVFSYSGEWCPAVQSWTQSNMLCCFHDFRHAEKTLDDIEGLEIGAVSYNSGNHLYYRVTEIDRERNIIYFETSAAAFGLDDWTPGAYREINELDLFGEFHVYPAPIAIKLKATSPIFGTINFPIGEYPSNFVDAIHTLFERENVESVTVRFRGDSNLWIYSRADD